MSDTVKVIIEIPKEIYERCKEYKLWSYDAETLEGAVAQGTPLDDVKTEINQLPLVLLVGYDHIEKDSVMQIIDNICRK